MNYSWELRSGSALPPGASGVHRVESGVENGVDGNVESRGAWALRWSGCAVMGVVNVTPDSFSDGGLFDTTDRAVDHAKQLVADGALIVDVGGESTRPGSSGVSERVELDRIIPVVTALAALGSTVISVDTRKPNVAAMAVEAGANIVNDIGGGRDQEMIDVCARLGVPLVVMHMQGTPIDMQLDPRYDDVVAEVTSWLVSQADAALAAGVPSVMVDPGIGFGKTFDHNVALLRALPLLPVRPDRPLMVGASRKRTVQRLAGLQGAATSDTISASNRDAASIAVALWAAHHGVAMVRAHDVAGHVAALAADAALRSSEN